MFRLRKPPSRSTGVVRRGLSLAELLIASALMAMIAAAIGTLALTVETSAAHAQGQYEAVQHARVVHSRLRRHVEGATANEHFPGCAVFADTIGSHAFPDTLVVWRPLAAPADPNGRPLFSELVVICPDPLAPQVLLELRAAHDSRTTPPLSNVAAWRTELAALKASSTTARTELTNLLRTASISTSSTSSTTTVRAGVRFHVQLRPSEAQWAEFRQGDRAWGGLDWPLDLYGANTGVRHVRCATELQLMPGESSRRQDPGGLSAWPFFGSAALWCELQQ